MTTPRFWSKFEIVYEDLNHSQVQQDDIMRTLQLWLRRSRQHPLSFRLIHKYAGSPTNPVGSTRYLTTLVSHASRWQNVQFHGPSESLVLLPSQLPNGKLPTLRSLSFHVNGSAGFPFDVASLNIPWSQLSGLDLQIYQDNAHSLNECFTFLSSAQNLTCVALNATFPFILGDHLETITLPYLRSFKLSIQGSDSEGTAELSLRDFLGHVSIPNLTTFSLEWLVDRVGDGGESCWTAVHHRFLDFLGSSANTLETLELAYLPIQDHEIIGCLDELPKLKSLDLKFSLSSQKLDPITDNFLDYLQRSREDATGQISLEHLHLLKTLKLQCSGVYLNQAMLQALVDNRAGVGLTAFELMTMKSMSRTFMDRVAMWRSRGFGFSVSTLNMW
ncbi:hypothetical protein AGABI1DRAFT_126466 [Agaricus bisporus var. burnettii JB137-S8]|uniref:F-box domain-containing protein n=1 Tax=Agaricus bisporus var. burnettii (strain JB137-S8 / ATCC MYA-4627 / FGSC 10392) TaxID=597362 RepID=K5XFX6_AGABU|nr:uncharacterized protein AGABI1DRAFT_126466 [Agaricus bisporus var. burnettii JB137-S8]EKM82117.1 hypothetical protein AGABI1DRAFT_126466 [Agaricus bisporus var. burnettii JB137-S8]